MTNRTKPWRSSDDHRSPLQIQMGMCARKSALPSRKIAKERAAQIRKVEGFPMSAYRCKFCGFWHLTSMVKA